MKTLSDFPTLQQAFNLMLADNIASVNFINAIRIKVMDQELEPVAAFEKAEAFLATLSPDDLYEVCCGDQDSCVEVSPDAGSVLAILFELIAP